MNWEAEVADLHAFFERWFSGDAARDEIGRLTAALAPGFTLISPDGVVRSKAAVIATVDASHGRSLLAIEVRNLRLLAETPTHLIARYEEWHNETVGRVSTVVFEHHDGALRWLTVHETAI